MATVAVTATSTIPIPTPTMSDSTVRVSRDHAHDGHSDTAVAQSNRSRENTPSTLSSHSLDTAPLDRTTSSASTSITNGEGSGSSFGQASQETQNDAGVERFLQKIDMEKVS